MIELENDKRIHELLEQFIRIAEKMHAYHEEHEETGELDRKANEMLKTLDAELERLISQDRLIDESVDEILNEVRKDVRTLVEQHRAEDRNDLTIKKHAERIRKSIEKDHKALEKDAPATRTELETPKLAHEMIAALVEKDTSFSSDAQLVKKIRASLRRIGEEEKGI